MLHRFGWSPVGMGLLAAIAQPMPAHGTSGPAAPTQDSATLRADGPPVWGEAPRLVEEIRIGRLDGSPEEVLGDVGGLAVTSDGTIWVGDLDLGAIHRYAADGSYIDQIGREGQGPGEFARPASLRVLPDGSVAVWDDGLIRVSRFAADGSFLDSFRPPTNMVVRGGVQSFEADVEGNLYVLASNLGELSRQEIARGGAARTFWIRTTLDGAVQDSIPMEPPESRGTIDRIQTSTVVSPLGYAVTARNDVYALDLHVSPAATVRIERSWEPVRYERAERAEKQRLEELMVSRNGRPMRRIPEQKPVFTDFEVDGEGRIWVQVAAPGVMEPETPGEQSTRERSCAFFGAPPAECEAGVRTWREPLVYEVIEPDGRYLGRLVFPNRQTDVMVARDDEVWVVETGGLGEAYVVRYRIGREERGRG